MTKAAVLPVVFDQASRASPTVLAASRVVGNMRATRSARGRNDIAMAIHIQLPSTAQRSPVCTGASAGCFCLTIPHSPSLDRTS
ncbi:hypothetical protein XavaCFBP5823_19940 [Xanthomonas axonopodis pv. vasculorum]|nr:hypothetical protein XavaCFBP5823_19940 [Xanthomonas axonopodis pv. vasculorum]